MWALRRARNGRVLCTRARFSPRATVTRRARRGGNTRRRRASGPCCSSLRLGWEWRAWTLYTATRSRCVCVSAHILYIHLSSPPRVFSDAPVELILFLQMLYTFPQSAEHHGWGAARHRFISWGARSTAVLSRSSRSTTCNADIFVAGRSATCRRREREVGGTGTEGRDQQCRGSGNAKGRVKEILAITL